jgi:hypothetical protein
LIQENNIINIEKEEERRKRRRKYILIRKKRKISELYNIVSAFDYRSLSF